ncbi:hypothetical protein VOLCADRAFT_106496 [Volvox carteri f. nagariensis]|uniref:Uncharacterized protein n=1 Tax=Volvox carteri f. nagariensis TaxID=3068 RepID=D8U7R7_VOLCA|nr:uncharacterized protein VOLCADRAFT_106496 [Volvox carteri f. nagariensis]EFJ44349.1 hypothetical protein VOLCADRAFT_106496 [Volvox carteri f. nagariensis]|eukprot:XP_002954708.1 hypothetical protein VOLCADRAFT_106496 [Volvox carteri f. nagariensis]
MGYPESCTQGPGLQTQGYLAPTDKARRAEADGRARRVYNALAKPAAPAWGAAEFPLLHRDGSAQATSKSPRALTRKQKASKPSLGLKLQILEQLAEDRARLALRLQAVEAACNAALAAHSSTGTSETSSTAGSSTSDVTGHYKAQPPGGGYPAACLERTPLRPQTPPTTMKRRPCAAAPAAAATEPVQPSPTSAVRQASNTAQQQPIAAARLPLGSSSTPTLLRTASGQPVAVLPHAGATGESAVTSAGRPHPPLPPSSPPPSERDPGFGSRRRLQQEDAPFHGAVRSGIKKPCHSVASKETKGAAASPVRSKVDVTSETPGGPTGTAAAGQRPAALDVPGCARGLRPSVVSSVSSASGTAVSAAAPWAVAAVVTPALSEASLRLSWQDPLDLVAPSSLCKFACKLGSSSWGCCFANGAATGEGSDVRRVSITQTHTLPRALNAPMHVTGRGRATESRSGHSHISRQRPMPGYWDTENDSTWGWRNCRRSCIVHGARCWTAGPFRAPRAPRLICVGPVFV